MKTRKLIFTQVVFLSATLFFSCNNNQPVSETYNFPVDTVQVDIDTYASSEKYIIKTDSIDIIRLIPLETKDESLIGTVSKLKVTNDRIFILDNDIAKALLAYDSAGKFLYRIGNKGNGPGEFFRGPHDFSINPEKKQIYVFEAESRKVVIFDWNGTFVIEKKFSKWPYGFALSAPDNYLFAYRTKSDQYEFSITGKEENSLFQFCNLRSDLNYTTPFPITINGDNMYFTPNLSTLLCKIGNDKITKGIYFDFGKYNLPQDLKTKMQKNYEPSLLNEKTYVSGIRNVLESDDLLYFNYPYGRMQFAYIFDKTNQVYRTGASLFEGFIPSNIQEIKKDTLLSTLTPHIYEHYNQIKNGNDPETQKYLSRIPEAFRQLLDTIPENANPTVCFFRIKSFR